MTDVVDFSIKHQDKIIKIIEMFCPNAKIYLFGSYARGDMGRSSDIDIAIDNGSPLDIITHQTIREMIDVLGLRQRTDVVDFQRAPSELKKNIIKDGVVWKS
jgi:predicted nucleotidyltransferase